MERMDKYAILTEKRWNQSLLQSLQHKCKSIQWILIDDKASFNMDFLTKNGVTKIFIPHWSYIIPEEIHTKFECIVFHMTDLPYGRGGSPLQNLILLGHKETKISALKVVRELDAGPIYIKRKLFLSGTAEEIFVRANKVIELMIETIVLNDIRPEPQEGEIFKFKRRKPADSNIIKIDDLEKVYNHIRMLDAEGYPKAYLETQSLKLEFSKAHLNSNEEIITAYVRIIKK